MLFIVPVVLIIGGILKLIIYNVMCQCQCDIDIISLRSAVSVQNEHIAERCAVTVCHLREF